MKRILILAAILTAAAAVPARAQISAVPTICSNHDSTATPAGTVDSLTVCAVPASVLARPAVHSTSLRVIVYGHVANNANAKSALIDLAGRLDSLPITASVANRFRFTCIIAFRTAGPGTGAQPFYCFGEQGPGTATSVISGGTVSFDPTVTQVIRLVIRQTSAGDATLDGFTVELVQ